MTTGYVSADALSYGDPHIDTFDGYHYDLQTVGEQFLSTDGVFVVQTRHARAGQASITSAVAFSYSVATVENRGVASDGATTNPIVLINGGAVAVNNLQGNLRLRSTSDPTPTSILDVGYFQVLSSISSGVATYRAHFYINGSSEAYEITVTVRSSSFGVQYLMVQPIYPASRFGLVRGLLRNFNGNPDDDLISASGEQFSTSITFEQLYDQFAESWRLTDANSLFTYGVNQSTATFTDRSFPSDATKLEISSYPSDMQAVAQQACIDLLGASEYLYSACMLDILANDGDVSYATAYLDVLNTIGGSYGLGQAPGLTQAGIAGIASAASVVGFGLLLVIICVATGKWKPRRIFNREQPKHTASPSLAAREPGIYPMDEAVGFDEVAAEKEQLERAEQVSRMPALAQPAPIIAPANPHVLVVSSPVHEGMNHFNMAICYSLHFWFRSITW